MSELLERDLGIFKKYQNLLNRINPNFIKNLIDETNKIEGWLCGYQIPLMWVIFSTLEGKAIEVGCWKGRATYAFKSNIPKDQFELFCVDPFLGSAEHKDSLQGASTRADFEKNLKDSGILDSISVIEKYSADAAKDFEDNSLDLIFIDAEHDYENVKLDILSWTPKLKSGGIIFGHDYPDPKIENAGFEGLAQAVNEEIRDSDKFSKFSYLFGIWGALKI
jgi:predicted O-methyltransferase YrrM